MGVLYQSSAIAALVVFAMASAEMAAPAGAASANRFGAKPSLQSYSMALDLYDIASADGDGLLMITAASLLARFRSVDGAGISNGQSDPGHVEAEGFVDFAAVMSAARRQTESNQALRSMVDDLAVSMPRGPLTAPTRYAGETPAGGRAIHTLTFRGNESSEILLQGAAGGLELAVLDENGREICRASVERRSVVCRWTPAWTATARVEIRNPDRVARGYQMLAN